MVLTPHPGYLHPNTAIYPKSHKQLAAFCQQVDNTVRNRENAAQSNRLAAAASAGAAGPQLPASGANNAATAAGAAEDFGGRQQALKESAPGPQEQQAAARPEQAAGVDTCSSCCSCCCSPCSSCSGICCGAYAATEAITRSGAVRKGATKPAKPAQLTQTTLPFARMMAGSAGAAKAPQQPRAAAQPAASTAQKAGSSWGVFGRALGGLLSGRVPALPAPPPLEASAGPELPAVEHELGSCTAGPSGTGVEVPGGTGPTLELAWPESGQPPVAAPGSLQQQQEAAPALSSRGPYICAKCARYGEVAVLKKGHKACPYAAEPEPEKIDGGHFNAKVVLQRVAEKKKRQ